MFHRVAALLGENVLSGKDNVLLREENRSFLQQMSSNWEKISSLGEKSGLSERRCPLLGCKCPIWHCHGGFLGRKRVAVVREGVFLGANLLFLEEKVKFPREKWHFWEEMT